MPSRKKISLLVSGGWGTKFSVQSSDRARTLGQGIINIGVCGAELPHGGCSAIGTPRGFIETFASTGATYSLMCNGPSGQNTEHLFTVTDVDRYLFRCP